MIYLYPANKMENLLALLDKIQQVSPLSFFESEIIVVQNAGMQHWLNLSLAQSRGISMNIDYALPAQYLWRLIRGLASEELVPEQSPFSREVLTWRIYDFLAEESVLNDADFDAVTGYWLSEKSHGNHLESLLEGNDEQAQLKRYQLSQKIADLYEQYLIYRPEWIDAWSKGIFSASGDANPFANESIEIQSTATWQGKLWQLLTSEQTYNPKDLVNDATKHMAGNIELLPKRLTFFGLNSMAPIWLDFIQALSEHIDVHFFHLNPCFDYWGDIQSEKESAKKISAWTKGHEEEFSELGNPLLANLGQQGREFLALIQNVSTIDIEAFDQASGEATDRTSLLSSIQHDILTLNHPKLAVIADEISSKSGSETVGDATNSKQSKEIDNSIAITSCHSALREVQGLHDWLLHQFNQDKSLTPKDVIIMCPQIENYAPYIDAVFARGWQDIGDDIPPLPCSIADRVAKDAEPVIAAFLEVLTLPDSRFQVSQLLAFIRLPAMQKKFGITVEEIDKVSIWLEQASIHWGLDAEHKSKMLDFGEQAHDQKSSFTWEQGLSRLLRGLAYSDQEAIFQGQLLLPSVEGNDAELLGQLMLIIEQLQQYSITLMQPKTAIQWNSYLFELLDTLFDFEDEYCQNDLLTAFESLAEYCLHANFTKVLPLLVVADFLQSHFSQPDRGRQFMIGQVTFCSMVPMRSIPFKVVGVLGLNDGEFPRQRPPLGFDLLESTAAKLGDRSRRGDDRYLFLEAIISARQSLYLSYQGNNIKTNAEKQPSIVLKEFVDYLQHGYGWQHEGETKKSHDDVAYKTRYLAMQPFSLENYSEEYTNGLTSFDDKWLKIIGISPDNVIDNKEAKSEVNIAQPLQSVQNLEFFADTTDIISIRDSELFSFYQHPSKVFAKVSLNLDFTDRQVTLSDVEPFDIGSIETYNMRQALLSASFSVLPSDTEQINGDDAIGDTLSGSSGDTVALDISAEQQIELQFEVARLSGKFPDLPTTQKEFDGWKNDNEEFSQSIMSQHAENPQTFPLVIPLKVSMGNSKVVDVEVQVSLPIKSDKLVHYRATKAKIKDKFILYFYQIVLQTIQELSEEVPEELAAISNTVGYFFDTKSQKSTEFVVSPVTEPVSKLRQLIQIFIEGQENPLLLNGDLAEAAFKLLSKGKVYSQETFEKTWSDDNQFLPIGSDPYVQYFWPKCPQVEDILPLVETVYSPLFEAVSEVKKSSSKAKPKASTKSKSAASLAKEVK